MKDYSINYNDYKMFILSYTIDGDKIIINYADGEKRIIPYTLENEKKILVKLKKQVVIGDINKNIFNNKIKKSLPLMIMHLLLVLFSIVVFITGTSALPVLNTIILILSSISSFIYMSVIVDNKKKLKDIKKNIEFLNNQDKINKFVKEREYVLENINDKTKEVLEPIIENKKEININDVDKISYNNLHELIDYMERIENLNIEVEEKSKVLTKKNNS